MGWRDWEDWPRPIPVEHGIRARSQRGQIGETWWSRRFVEALSTRVDEGRLARGKRYARAGQVVSLDIARGRVNAKVQGSRPAPYVVAITVPVLGDAQWRAVASHMASRARTLASLLNGEMPHEVEESFLAAGADLFGVAGIRAACTCPDDAPVCKHIAAVFLLMAEAFDRDPFLMLAWRGRRRDDLLRELRAMRTTESRLEAAESGAAVAPGEPEAAESTPAPRPARTAGERRSSPGVASGGAPEPAVPGAGIEAGRARSGANGMDPAAVAAFWGSGADPAELRVLVRPTTPPDAILRDVDDDTLVELGGEFLERLRPIYESFVPVARHRLDPAADEPSTRGRSGSQRSATRTARSRPSPAGFESITRSEAPGSRRPRRG